MPVIPKNTSYFHGQKLECKCWLRVSWDVEYIAYHISVIDSVTPSSGSLVGGTLLTIEGNYFDETDAPLEVLIGGKKNMD